MVDHVILTCLAEYLGTRDDSLSWNLRRVKQCEAIQVDNIESSGLDTPRSKKVQILIKDGLLRRMNAQMAEMHIELMDVSEVNDVGHDVFISKNRM